MLAVSVITPSRSSRTASYLFRVIARFLSGCCIGLSFHQRTSVTERTTALNRSYAPGSDRALASERPIPDLHSRYVAVTAEDAQGARIEQKMLPAACRQPNPPCREHAQHMAVREQRDVTVSRARPGDHPVYPRTHFVRRLAARASIPEDQPARCDLVDLLGRYSFVLAVVPLDQVGVDDSLVAETRQLTGLPRPLHGAAKNERERVLGQHRPQPFGDAAPTFGQRNVRCSGVLAAQAPCRLAVSDREHVHPRILRGQTLSASVERTPTDAASCPHRQPVISGMSSPYRAINSLWSMSLSRIACFA